MKKQYLLGLLAVFLLAVSCKQSVEGESSKWEANKQRLSSLGAKYSNFKPAIEATLQEAQAAWDAAQSVSDEKAKIKAMSEANAKASPEFVRNLESVDDKINKIRDLAAKAAQQAGDHSDSDAAWVAKTNADRTISESQSSLRTAAPSSAGDANAVVGSIIKNLEAAQKSLDDVVKVAESKKEENKKAEENKTTAEENKKAEEEKKASPIKCGYCSTSNAAGSTKCSSCGADLN